MRSWQSPSFCPSYKDRAFSDVCWAFASMRLAGGPQHFVDV